MKGLTQKQREILEFIQRFIKENAYSPSYREIMHHFSLSSPGSVYKHIQTLKRKGVLIGEKQCSRSISPIASTLVLPKKSEVEIAFIGNLSAGYPVDLFREPQMLSIPSFLVPSPEHTYVLQVQGEGMQEEAIYDGDLLLIEARQEAQDGETVLALINQHDTTIKRYHPEGQYIRLEGRQLHVHPLILRADSVIVQGVLVGLLRSY